MRYLFGVLAGLGLLLLPPQAVFACSAELPSPSGLADFSELVVVGTLVNPTDDVITLKVEDVLKGDPGTADLTINNHTLSNDPSCKSQLGDSGRFSDGMRVMAFLQRDEFDIGAEWRPAGPAGQFIFSIDQKRNKLLFANTDSEYADFEEARAAILEAAGTSNSSPPVQDPAVNLTIMPAPAISGGDAVAVATVAPVEVHPLPADMGGLRGEVPGANGARNAAVAEPGLGFPLPEILLGIFVTISVLLLLWALVQLMRRKPLH